MIKLYCFPRSGNSREVKIALAEKGLEYESINIREDESVKESPEFKKASPKGTVPALIDGEAYLSEAYQINEYLEDKYPNNSLLPSEDQPREEIKQWVARYDKTLVLKIGLLLIECILKPEDKRNPDIQNKLKNEINEQLHEVDQFLEDKEYLFDKFSLADIALIPHLSALPRLGLSINEKTPKLKSWFERVKQRPSFNASLN